ncbi:hypothetical protein ABZ946_32015 [Streptomyces sp. NPDC046324]|uniref:hypothetical protein n=1 Tax=Streptomyces sp. NPDC046324 TaxID=3154915 RepID=UPI0033F5B959
MCRNRASAYAEAVRTVCPDVTQVADRFDAVAAGRTLEWSSGKVEGNVNWVKRIKRDGYGRAGFDLLRRQILHAD